MKLQTIHTLIFIPISILLIGIIFVSCRKECTTSPTSQSNAIAVYAGKSQIITVSGDTARLTGTILSGRPNSYLWTTLSGPNSPIINSSDSLSALATGLSVGTYIFQLKASSTDNVGLDTTTVQVAKHLSLRIDSTSKVYDFVLLNTSDNSSHAGPDLFTGWWTSGGLPFDVKSIFEFDLSTLPANATILTARLTLYSDSTPVNGDHLGDANSGANNAFYIERVTTNWNYTNTWFTIPSTDTANQILIPTTILSQLDITDLDVTSMVDSMRVNNYGFEMRLQDTVIYTTRIFCSGFYGEASRHPKLDIYYQ
jgi:hypothetical protein